MNSHHVEGKGRVRVLFTVLFGFVIVTVALHWGWNTFAVEVLGQDAIRFKHALAFETILFSLAATILFTCRLFDHHTLSG